MTVRPRRGRRHVHALTLPRFLELELGPMDDEREPFDLLMAVFDEHRSRFDSSSWATRYRLEGVDDRPRSELLVDGDDDTALPGFDPVDG